MWPCFSPPLVNRRTGEGRFLSPPPVSLLQANFSPPPFPFLSHGCIVPSQDFFLIIYNFFLALTVSFLFFCRILNGEVNSSFPCSLHPFPLDNPFFGAVDGGSCRILVSPAFHFPRLGLGRSSFFLKEKFFKLECPPPSFFGLYFLHCRFLLPFQFAE